jgi:hypothetical protein
VWIESKTAVERVERRRQRTRRSGDQRSVTCRDRGGCVGWTLLAEAGLRVSASEPGRSFRGKRGGTWRNPESCVEATASPGRKRGRRIRSSASYSEIP